MLLVAVWTWTCHFPSFLFFGCILQSPFLQNCIVCESYFLSMLNTVSHNIGGFLCKHILLLQTSKVLVKTVIHDPTQVLNPSWLPSDPRHLSG